MTWLTLTLFCIVMWGFTDILLKKSLNYSDPLSQLKTFVWIGLISFFLQIVTCGFCLQCLRHIPFLFYLSGLHEKTIFSKFCQF